MQVSSWVHARVNVLFLFPYPTFHEKSSKLSHSSLDRSEISLIFGLLLQLIGQISKKKARISKSIK